MSTDCDRVPFPHRYVSSLEERLQNFGKDSKAKMDAVQKDFDIRAAAAEAEVSGVDDDE